VETPRKFITAVINLRGVSTNKTIYFIAMQTYKELITYLLYPSNPVFLTKNLPKKKWDPMDPTDK
jgi:hypothetical protein